MTVVCKSAFDIVDMSDPGLQTTLILQFSFTSSALAALTSAIAGSAMRSQSHA